MRILYEKYDKQRIPDLPRAVFQGRIIVVQTVNEAEKAVDYLLTHPLLGVDTETRPTFTKGNTHKVSLLQVSTDDTCFLFRLNYIDVPTCIVRLLQEPRTAKVGLSLRDDFSSLHKRRAFDPRSFIELQDYVAQFGIQDKSLQKIYANIFGQKISKTQQLTNWETDVLTENQKLYAATDAWACLKLYLELRELKEKGNYILTPAQNI